MRTLACLALIACGGHPAVVPASPPAALPAAAPAPEVAVPAVPKHPWPSTRTDDIVEQLQGKTVKDPYRWLEDEKSPEVQAWMTAQDDFARKQLAGYAGRDEIAKRVAQLFYFDAVGAPIKHGDREFYTRKFATKEKTVVYTRDAKGEHVLFDPNTWSEDGSKGLHGWWPSWDGKHVAYNVSEHNSDETTMHVIDVATGRDLPDIIEGTKYAAASWTPDGHGFYYTWVPAVGAVPTADRPGYAELRFHKLGGDVAKDPVVHEATKNPQTFLGGGISRDGHWLLAFVQHGWSSSDIYFKDARKQGPWQVLVEGVAANFDATVWRDHFYVTTNDGAARYRIFKVDPHKPAREQWREIVPESDATLQTTQVIGEHLVLTYLRNAASELEIHDLDGKLSHKLELPPLGTASGMSGNPDEDIGYVSYTSFTEPQVIYKASVKTGKVEEWNRIKLPVDTSGFVTEQVFYPSKDGTKISMFIIHNKGAQKDGSNPTILYGYGGFNVSMTPAFAGSRAVWLEHGGVYAIPNLRGGGEYGEDWHQAGMGAKKQNVFDDYIAAAEYLIKEGWTSQAHLAISGGSNGGLLVGAALTQRPDLYRAVICAVPLLDMLRYHLYGSGKTWIPEYGSADDPAQFATLWAYSPYRVAVDAGARRYPAVLFDSADHDDRVDPLHARKLAAVLQANQTATYPILLRIERNAGHGGADMVKSQVERVADQFAFLLDQLSR
ncbi:MAG TPA: prolyl oligopeptidase family serine peptidase [Kofleriaceae bacterium]|nr:prolyl oligopeptidase family serine peptidase [Kofleriaceae bacterium]